ncbi:conjugal transfer protein TraN [Acinetobacter baumannii]|nr:conjugal transfer protein TraN [Acinetobacter baumannii]
MNKFFLPFMAILLSTNIYANSSQGQQLGLEAGNQGLGGASSAVNQGNGSQWLPGYSERAKEEGYYQGGMGNVNQSGADKYARCANANAVLTADEKIECDAINFVNKNPRSRKLYEVDPKKDPVIKSSNEIKNNTFESFKNNQTCFQKTVKTNPVYEEQVCTQGVALSEQQCFEQTVNDVCPTSYDGNTCNGETGIDRGALTASGDHNSYIKYEGNKLKFGLGYRWNSSIGSSTSTFKVTIRNRAKLNNIKLLNSTYDDAYLLKINGVEALAVNIGGANDGTTGFSSNQELGQYFVEGENKIELTVYNNVRNSPYYADLIIDIPMYCECTKKKTNTCSEDILKNANCGVKDSICLEKDWKGDCIKKQLNYLCKNTMYTQKKQSCQTQTQMQCKNPSGVLRDKSTCDQGIDYDTIQMTQNDGNGSFNKLPTSFTVSTSGNDGKRGSSKRNYVVTFNIKDVNSTKMFLKQVHYDNRGIVYVNGTEVFNRSTNSNQTDNVNIDLKPYLHVGSNTIRLYIDNWAGPWSGSINVETDYQCSCQEQKIDTCSTNSSCKLLSETCSDDSTKIINGVMVKGCWNTTKNYSCEANGTTVSDCRPLLERGCSQIGSVCTSKDANGTCLTYSQKYQCEKTPAKEEEQTICVDVDCVDGKCLEKAADQKDADFAQAVTMMEAAREAGVYMEKDYKNTLRLFVGEENKCTVKLLAGSNIMSCCKEVKINASSATNKNSGSTATGAFANDPNAPPQQTQGSSYQYDDVYNDNKTMKQLQSQLTFGWLECSEGERELGIKRGSSLCTHARTWCSKKDPIFGSCLEESRAWCCFKSILAKIINRQGRAQLGLSLETCEGIKIEELQRLDFSKMDLTEFKNSITPANMNLDERVKELRDQVTKRSVGGYYNDAE